MKTKYMTFTKVAAGWEITNNKSGATLGGIAWYNRWRQLVFVPEGGCVFNKGCLEDIIKFMEGVDTDEAGERTV